MREVKKRSIKCQTGENAVQMRVHRRSIEQKSNREKIFLKGRPGLDNVFLAPVLEESNDVVPMPPPSKARDVRKEMLQRWKEEKMLKAKLKSEKMGKPFKITKINHSQPIFLFSEKQVNGKPITASASNAINESMRITRSKMNTSIVQSTQPQKRILPVRVVKSSKPQTVALVPAKKVTRTAKGAVKPIVTKPQRCETVTSATSPPAEVVVPKKREPSFAPLQFSFTAPSGISPFFFQASETIRVEKLLPPLNVVSDVSSIENVSPSVSKDNSSNGEPGNLISNAEKEPEFKTPHGAVKRIRPLKISPLLENNPNICTTRGRPSSSKKQSPIGSRLSEADLSLAPPKFDIELTKDEDSTQCLPSESNLEGNENVPSKEVATEKNASFTVDEPQILTPSRQLRSKTAKNSPVSRDSLGMTLTPSYFRKMLDDHTKELKTLCNTWQEIMETEQERISENIKGKIRTTIGQSELLMSERFKQFSGLIDDCELKRGKKVTTCFDLQGFWEMIFFQVEDVKEKFGRLEEMKRADWEDMVTPLKKQAVVVKRAVRRNPKAEAKPNASAAAQAARQRLAEAKAKAAQLRKAAKNLSPKNEIFVGEKSLDSPAQSRVQESMVDKQVKSEEISFSGGKNDSSRQRKSLRSSLHTVKETSTEDEIPTSTLLLPVPVLESLNLNSPLARGSPRKRLSELFSPLSSGTKGAMKKLETILDNEDSEMATHEQNDIPAYKQYKPAVTPQKRVTRSSNLIRFSDALCNPAESGKENANLLTHLN